MAPNPMDKFISVSSIEDLSYTPTSEQSGHWILKNRKSYKMVRGGNGEPVWSPHIEAALIEALTIYHSDQPSHSKTGRKTNRNKFISEYIYRTTGKERSPTQVSSRLQQLRGSCRGRSIKELLSRKDCPSGKSSPEPVTRHSPSTSRTAPPNKVKREHVPYISRKPSLASLYSSSPSPSSSASSECDIRSPITPPGSISHLVELDRCNVQNRIPININILPRPSIPWNSTSDSQPVILSGSASPVPSGTVPFSGIQLPSGSTRNGFSFVFPPSYDHPRTLSEIEPRITFISPIPISTYTHFSSFSVLLDGLCVHTESTRLAPACHLINGNTASELHKGGAFTYTTSFIPGYWKTLCESPDPTRYTIFQDILYDYKTQHDLDFPPVVRDLRDRTISAQYRFRYCERSSPASTSSISWHSKASTQDISHYRSTRLHTATFLSHSNSYSTGSPVSLSPTYSGCGGNNLQLHVDSHAGLGVAGNNYNTMDSIKNEEKGWSYPRWNGVAISQTAGAGSSLASPVAYESSCFPSGLTNYIL